MPVAQPGCPTGLTTLDELTGGLRGTTILAGPRGSGRSTLALQLTRGVLARNPGLVALYISWTLPPKEQIVRMFAMESGIKANWIRAGHPTAIESQAYLDAWTRLDREVRPRLLITEEVGPAPTYPHALTGKPFDPWTVMAYRGQLMQATGASGCLIVVDDFVSIGVPANP